MGGGDVSDDTVLPFDISQLNAALRNSMNFSQNFLDQDREVSIYVNDSMSQAGGNLENMMYEGESQHGQLYPPPLRMFSTTKKPRAKPTHFDHVPEEDSDYMQSPLDFRSDLAPMSVFTSPLKRDKKKKRHTVEYRERRQSQVPKLPEIVTNKKKKMEQD